MKGLFHAQHWWVDGGSLAAHLYIVGISSATLFTSRTRDNKYVRKKKIQIIIAYIIRKNGKRKSPQQHRERMK